MSFAAVKAFLEKTACPAVALKMAKNRVMGAADAKVTVNDGAAAVVFAQTGTRALVVASVFPIFTSIFRATASVATCRAGVRVGAQARVIATKKGAPVVMKSSMECAQI